MFICHVDLWRISKAKSSVRKSTSPILDHVSVCLVFLSEEAGQEKSYAKAQALVKVQNPSASKKEIFFRIIEKHFVSWYNNDSESKFNLSRRK